MPRVRNILTEYEKKMIHFVKKRYGMQGLHASNSMIKVVLSLLWKKQKNAIFKTRLLHLEAKIAKNEQAASSI